jgi:aryl-alcohol dehydrogenase-like predicted oxidoreductase
LEAYERLIRAGKVRAIGASHYSASRLQEALDTSRSKQLPRYNSLQPRYNLCDRSEFEDGLQSLCVERSLGAITYSSLAKGFLTGRYRCEADCERSAWYTRLLEYLTERGFRILEALESVAAVHESSMAGVALAWALAQPGVAATIVAANSVSELGELLGAAELKLEVGELQDLSAASAPDGDEVALGNPEIHSRTWSART